MVDDLASEGQANLLGSGGLELGEQLSCVIWLNRNAKWVHSYLHLSQASRLGSTLPPLFLLL